MEPPSVTRRGTLAIRLAMAAAFIVTLALCSSHGDFPFVYHPDEPAKVEQVLTGKRNFNHPPLMLTLTRAALDGTVPLATPQHVARTGRFLSALALALAVAALTWLAGVYGGAGGAACAAAALCTDAQAVLAGHFFKEDALFALGLALTFCAGALHWRRRSGLSLLGLGAAAGLALSTKYVGALALGYALTLAVLGSRQPEAGSRSGTGMAVLRAAGGCALGAAAMFLLLNGAALAGHFAEWRQGMALGISVSQQGNQAVGARIPHPEFVGMFFLLTPLPVMVGAAVFWAGLRQTPFLLHADRWLAGLSPLWLLAAFSFSASTAVRYFLPISLMLDCAAGAAWPGIVRWGLGAWERRRGRSAPAWLAAVAGPGAILLFTVPVAWNLVDGFGRDDRAALRQWIAGHLPPSAVIAEDALARLEDAAGGGDPKLTQRLLALPCVADFGDVAALRARGVSCVVVCWYNSRRYTDAGKRPGAGAVADFERRGAFYRSLPQQARLLWQSGLRQPYALRPGLELYQIGEK